MSHRGDRTRRNKIERREGESLDSMLRKFKRKVKNDGVLQDLRDREHFKKPSEQKKEDRRVAERRTFLEQKQDEL